MADPTPAASATPDEVAAFRSEQDKEWNTYFAVAPISYGGVLAYNAGDPVPVSNVARHGYEAQGLVAKVGTKAGDAAIQEIIAAATPTGPADVAAPVSLNITVPK